MKMIQFFDEENLEKNRSHPKHWDRTTVTTPKLPATGAEGADLPPGFDRDRMMEVLKIKEQANEAWLEGHENDPTWKKSCTGW